MPMSENRNRLIELISDPSAIDSFLDKPQAQSFGFENYQPPQEQPWSMPTVDKLLAESLSFAPRMMMSGYQYGQEVADDPQKLIYDLTDTSLEEYISDADRAALPFGDPRRDAVGSVMVGDWVAGAGAKMMPSLGRQALKHGPQAMDAVNRQLTGDLVGFNPKLDITGYHYGRKEGLSELDASFHGEGAMGKERSRFKAVDEDLRPTYFYLDEGEGVVPEVEVSSAAKSVYKAELDNLYDKNTDPDGLWKASMDETAGLSGTGNPMPALAIDIFSRKVKDAGFTGYKAPNPQTGRMVGAVFGKTPVEELPAGSTSNEGIKSQTPTYDELMTELGDIDNLPETFKTQSGAGSQTPPTAGFPEMLKPQSGTGYALGEAMHPPAGPLALPNPDKYKLANEILREEKWTALDKAEKAAGVKRQKSTGRYIGGPAGITTPQKKSAQAGKYAGRIEAAEAAGIPEGYFYQSGRDAIESFTPDVAGHRRFAKLMGPTSTQVGPYQNLNYAIRAHDQQAMGNPINVGLYPNSLRGSVQAALYGDEPWTGYKVDRYSNLLGPEGHAVSSHPSSFMPPNDQWEGYGVGFNKGHVPSGATQVAFADNIRDQALTRVNKKRVAAGKKPYTLEEAQELHWLAIRAESEGRPLELGPKDTVQGSLPSFTAQHSWEGAPTPAASHQLQMDLDEYTNELYSVFSDEQGKDRLISGMGGDLQLPMVRGTGIYKGEPSSGVQSRSLAAKTEAGGLDPSSRKRIDATEAVRQYALGQQARAGNIPLSEKSKVGSPMVEAAIGRIPNPDEMAEIDRIVNEIRGKGWTSQGERAATVFTPEGYRVLDVTGIDKSGFKQDIDAKIGELEAVTGGGKFEKKKIDTIYGEYDWGKGGVTEELLNVLDDPAFPNVKELANSPETRRVMGDVANLYKKLEAEGKLRPNQKLVNVLDAWASAGLPEVRRLVSAGLAPAAVIGVFAGLQDEQRPARGA